MRAFLDKSRLPVTGTYQAAKGGGYPPFRRFCRAGGAVQQPAGDKLLQDADLVVCIGYSPIEYDPVLWNGTGERQLLHIDALPAEIDSSYCAAVELVGSISANLARLTRMLHQPLARIRPLPRCSARSVPSAISSPNMPVGWGHPIHPLRIVKELQDIIGQDMTLCVDMGSFHIWIARYLYSFRARQVLISNGQQTMGVALPWAIGAAMVRPGEKIISVSGDGSFMQSSMELETAVRLKSNIVHIIWVDNGYNMVAMQEEKSTAAAPG